MKILSIAALFIASSFSAFAATPLVSFKDAGITVHQTDSLVRIPVKLSAPIQSDSAAGPSFSTINETASYGDFDTNDSYIEFQPGEVDAELILGISPYPKFSGNKTFKIRLTTGFSGLFRIGTPAVITITIIGGINPTPPVKPLITVASKKISGGRTQLLISAVDLKGVKATKKVIVAP